MTYAGTGPLVCATSHCSASMPRARIVAAAVAVLAVVGALFWAGRAHTDATEYHCPTFDPSKHEAVPVTFLALAQELDRNGLVGKGLHCAWLAHAHLARTRNEREAVRFSVPWLLSKMLFRMRDVKRALPIALEAVAVRPHSAIAASLVARCLNKLDRVAEAREYLVAFSERDERDNVDAPGKMYFALAELYGYAPMTDFQLSKTSKANWTHAEMVADLTTAVAYADRAIAAFGEQSAESARSFQLRGNALAHMGRIEEGIASLRRAAELFEAPGDRVAAAWNAAAMTFSHLLEPAQAKAIRRPFLADSVRFYFTELEAANTRLQRHSAAASAPTRRIAFDWLADPSVETTVLEDTGERIEAKRQRAGETLTEVYYERTVYLADFRNVSLIGKIQPVITTPTAAYLDVHDDYVGLHLPWLRYAELRDPPMPEERHFAVGILAGGVSGGNFYHFMAEVLVRVVYLLETPEVVQCLEDGGSVAVLLHRRYAFQTAYLERVIAGLQRLGMPLADDQMPVVLLDEDENSFFSFDRLLTVDWRWPESAPADVTPPSPIEFLPPRAGILRLRDVLNPPVVEDEQARNAIVFVSRRGHTNARGILNEDDVVAALRERYGERVVVFSGSGQPIEEQMATFARAAVVIAHHGSAQVNLMYCHAGTHMVEFEARNLHYFSYLSAVFGLHFHAIPVEHDDAWRQNIQVDIAGLLLVLDSLHV